MNLSEITTEQLKAELKSRGYYVDNLWQEADIDTLVENYNSENGTAIELDKDQKQEILHGVLNGDGTMQDVNDQLSYFFDDYIEDNNLVDGDIADDTQDAHNLDKY
jgi:hypothetical protein